MTPAEDSNINSVHGSSAESGSSAEWSRRCADLFEELRRPARAMVSRAYGRALSGEEIEDVYAAAWAATLSALRTRGDRMSDEELRAYVLTAVASHASKELRRRSRRPAGSLDAAHEQAISDVHASLPEEAAIGSESSGVVRDLLVSLPARRRAVMLLRYGWGLSPKEVCALVDGLSPRAYRKEVTRGVEQLIERLAQVESGEWCRSREELLRDYVAGTASEEQRLQAEHHLSHCRDCSRFASRLADHLNDFGGGFALAGVAALIGGGRLGLADRLAEMIEGVRASAATALERGESAVGAVLASGGFRGSGAAGAGLAAKIAAAGGGKVALACLGTGAAATACLAAGVVPGFAEWGTERPRRTVEAPVRAERGPDRRAELNAHAATRSVVDVGESVAAAEVAEPAQNAPPGSIAPVEAEAPEAPAPAPAPAPDPTAEEFDPVASAAAAPPTPTPTATEPAGEPSAPVDGGSVEGDEFGP